MPSRHVGCPEYVGGDVGSITIKRDLRHALDCHPVVGAKLRGDLGEEVKSTLGHNQGRSQLLCLGDLALDRGDLNAAIDFYRRSLAELPGRSPATVVVCLAGIASVLAERKRDETAATIWGAVCVAEELLGFRMIATERRRYETRLARLEGTLAWEAGKDLTLEQALALVSQPLN